MVSEGKRDGNFMKNREIHGESNVWITAQGSTDLMSMLCLSEGIDQLAMANSVRWYVHVLRREGGHIMRRAFDFEVEGQRKKGRLKRTWKKQIEEESVKVGLRMEDALCRSTWSFVINQIAAGLR